MTKGIETLLNNVGNISNKYKTIAQVTGGNFNIFEIVNISHKEVYMCRLLSELLNPSGSHHQGSIYLKLFFETLKRNYGDTFNLTTPENAEVLREEGIVGYRRIDISIDDEEHRQYLPIEVKIYAQDQKDQCKDYLTKKAKPKYNQGENARLCYLTIDGSLPDESSLGDMSDAERAQIIEISWRKDIIEWLDACIMHKNTIEKAPIREVLIQFKKAVQKFTNQLEENEEMDIEELLINDPENFENAEKIYKAFEGAKKRLLENFKDKLLERIENQMGKKPDENYCDNILNDWNIGCKLKDLGNNRIDVVRVSYVKKDGNIQMLRQNLCADWSANGGVNTIGSPKIIELYKLSKNCVDSKIQDCVDWIIGEIEKSKNADARNN